MKASIEIAIMKHIIILLVVLGFTACVNQTEQTITSTNFQIEIKESGMISDNSFIISQDSLSVKKVSPSMVNYNSEFSKKLSLADKQLLIEELNKIDLSIIQKNYVNNSAPDDMLEYDFKITIDGQTKEFHIYQVKIDNIFNLVRQINTLLPEKFKIGYNDEYFKK